MQKFKLWMQQVVDLGLDEKVSILAGITPMKSIGMARYMKSRVPGMDVPEGIIDRLRGAPRDKVAAEGINIAVEQIQELKECKGVRGFHIMAIEWEEKVPEIVERAGLYPRPEVD
jgi:methylenetetrahydrofolate reductase (NADPH)